MEYPIPDEFIDQRGFSAVDAGNKSPAASLCPRNKKNYIYINMIKSRRRKNTLE